MARGDLAKGFVVGVVVAAATPLVIAAMGTAGRPLGRALVRSGRILGDKAREAAAELLEVAEDTIAELQALEAEPTEAERSAGEASRRQA
jgi:hypothetical protein